MDLVKIKNDLLAYFDKEDQPVIEKDNDEIDMYVLDRFKEIYKFEEKKKKFRKKINNCNKNKLLKFNCCNQLFCCEKCHCSYSIIRQNHLPEHNISESKLIEIHCLKCKNVFKTNKETKCGKCYKPKIQTNYKRCIKSKKVCSICLDKLEGEMVIQFKCNHVIHKECYEELIKFSNKCPMCYKLIKNSKEEDKILDVEIEMNPMIEKKNIDIYCYECEKYSNCRYHYIGNKCKNCGSYNTREN